MKKLCFVFLLLAGAYQVSAQYEGSDTTPVFVYVEQMPGFPGGNDSLNAFLARTIVYPAKAKAAGIQGKVMAQFDVRPKGDISNIQVLRTPDKEMGEEVIRVIRLMPRWHPGKQNGKAVPVRFTLPVTFRLD